MSRSAIERVILTLLLVCKALQVASDCSKWPLLQSMKDPPSTACAAKSNDVTESGLTDAEKKFLLDYHNEKRAAVTPTASNMGKMYWDDEIAAIAQAHADTCPDKDHPHDTNNARKVIGRYTVGQNLATLTNVPKYWKGALDRWYNEHNDYTFGVSNDDPDKVVGHYTQMVWATSVLLGCGYALCGGIGKYVCNYAPAGNVGKAPPYIQGAPCSACTAKCSNGKLCDCDGQTCFNGGKMDVNTCACTSCTSKENSPFSKYMSTADRCLIDCQQAENHPIVCLAVSVVPKDCDGATEPSCPIKCKTCPAGDKSKQNTNRKPPTSLEGGGTGGGGGTSGGDGSSGGTGGGTSGGDGSSSGGTGGGPSGGDGSSGGTGGGTSGGDGSSSTGGTGGGDTGTGGNGTGASVEYNGAVLYLFLALFARILH